MELRINRARPVLHFILTDPPTRGLLQESQTLTLSGTGSKISARLSVTSSIDGRSGSPTGGGATEDEDSDWDSWDEEDVSDQAVSFPHTL